MAMVGSNMDSDAYNCRDSTTVYRPNPWPRPIGRPIGRPVGRPVNAAGGWSHASEEWWMRHHSWSIHKAWSTYEFFEPHFKLNCSTDTPILMLVLEKYTLPVKRNVAGVLLLILISCIEQGNFFGWDLDYGALSSRHTHVRRLVAQPVNYWLVGHVLWYLCA